MLMGEKVILRPAEKKDLDYLYKWYHDPELVHWGSGNHPHVEKSMVELEDENWGSLKSNDKKSFMIEDKQGNVIGRIAYKRVDYINRKCEIGISLGSTEILGKGYGTDALTTFLKFLFFRMNMNRVELDTFEDNIRAIKCYKKCGFKEEGRKRKALFINGEYKDQVFMGVLREEFKPE